MSDQVKAILAALQAMPRKHSDGWPTPEQAVSIRDTLAAAGFKVFAREPSRLMIEIAEQGDDWRSYDEIWVAMWDAAP
jgi:hypothetical protein